MPIYAVLRYASVNKEIIAKNVEFYNLGDYMIKRDRYLNQLINAKDNGFPKVITGVRRCGKSFLLKEIYREYLLSQDVPESRIIILELDDDKNSKYRDPLELGAYIREKCKDKENYYVFIDEIQKVYSVINPNLTDGKHVLANSDDTEVISFVDVVLGLSREKNIDLYVTGSNSKMLSSDIVTEFRDKATNIKLSPLSFEEYYDQYKNKGIETTFEMNPGNHFKDADLRLAKGIAWILK